MSEKATLDKAVKISIIASVVIIALTVAYWLIVFLPQKEKKDRRAKTGAKKTRPRDEVIFLDKIKTGLKKVSNIKDIILLFSNIAKSLDLSLKDIKRIIG